MINDEFKDEYGSADGAGDLPSGLPFDYGSELPNESLPDDGTPPTDALGTIEAYSDDDYEAVDLPVEGDDSDYETVALPSEYGEAKPVAESPPSSPAEYDDAPAEPTYYDSPDPATQGSIDRVRDIPLSVNVELGRTRKEISEILEFGHGTIVVLDKLAGDPVEVFANGKLIARGEVVIIDENYGVRITEIVS